MAKIEMHSESALSPEEVVSALTDFSESRPQRWTGVTPEYYEVYSVGDTEAHIKEGTQQGPINVWAKEHYDWSQPGVVRWTVEESNFCTPGSYVQATITPREGGGSKIDTEWERTPTTVMARMILVVMKMTGGKAIETSMRKGLANYERSAAG